MTQTTQAPERIYHWLDSQLSIARFYGGIHFRGARYVIAFNEPGQPLVRKDVLEREAKARKAAAKARKAAAKAEQARNDKLQERLI